MEAACRRRPVLCVLDDLHWGDLPTVRFIDAALRNLRHCRFMVCGLASAKIHERFPELWLERNVERIPLRPLSRRACGELVRNALPEGTARELIERLVEQCAGNPFYLEELLRKAASGDTDELPDTILATASMRLRELSSGERRVLRAASAFGRRFWSDGVAELLGENREAVDAILGRLCDCEIVTRERSSRFPGFPAYSFRKRYSARGVVCHVHLGRPASRPPGGRPVARAHRRARTDGAGRTLLERRRAQASRAVVSTRHRAGPWRPMIWTPPSLGPSERWPRGPKTRLWALCGCFRPRPTIGRASTMRPSRAVARLWRSCRRPAMAGAHCAHQVAWASYATMSVEDLEGVAEKLVKNLARPITEKRTGKSTANETESGAEQDPEGPSDLYLVSIAICAVNLATIKRRERAGELLAILTRCLQKRPPRATPCRNRRPRQRHHGVARWPLG